MPIFTDTERTLIQDRVVEYLTRFPFYKWAAKYAGISKDTLEDWRKVDDAFSVRCEHARAYALDKLGRRATPDFMLKSADPETFKERVDVTSGGKPIPILGTINVIPTNNSHNKDPGIEEKN